MCSNRTAYLSSVSVTAITCGHPGNPINGLTQGNQFNLNDVVKFVCNPGYVSEGAAGSQCLANGQWSDTLPTCRSESPCSPTHPRTSAICGSTTREQKPLDSVLLLCWLDGEDWGQRRVINGDFLNP